MSGRYMEVRGLQPGPVYGLKVVAVVANCEAEGGRPQHFPKIYMFKYFYILLLPQNILRKNVRYSFRLLSLQIFSYCAALHIQYYQADISTNFVKKVKC
jgi:hypothetical protein